MRRVGKGRDPERAALHPLAKLNCTVRSQARESSALAPRIEIPDDDVQHLAGEARVALGHDVAAARRTAGVDRLAAVPCDGGQACATVANEAEALRLGDALVEGPGRNRVGRRRLVAAPAASGVRVLERV